MNDPKEKGWSTVLWDRGSNNMLLAFYYDSRPVGSISIDSKETAEKFTHFINSLNVNTRDPAPTVITR